MSGFQRDRRWTDKQSPAERAVAISRFRRRRTDLFAEPGLFGEPAYDILLELYIAHHEGRQVTISDACNAAHVPWTTAIWQVKRLHTLRLVRRLEDDRDRRRCYIALEPKALSVLNQLFT